MTLHDVPKWPWIMFPQMTLNVGEWLSKISFKIIQNETDIAYHIMYFRIYIGIFNFCVSKTVGVKS